MRLHLISKSVLGISFGFLLCHLILFFQLYQSYTGKTNYVKGSYNRCIWQTQTFEVVKGEIVKSERILFYINKGFYIFSCAFISLRQLDISSDFEQQLKEATYHFQKGKLDFHYTLSYKM